MEAANKVVTTAIERPSEATEPVKKEKETCNRILFILDGGEVLYRQLLREN